MGQVVSPANQMSALELMESIFALDEETMLKANHNGLGVVNKTPNRGEDQGKKYVVPY